MVAPVVAAAAKLAAQQAAAEAAKRHAQAKADGSNGPTHSGSGSNRMMMVAVSGGAAVVLALVLALSIGTASVSGIAAMGSLFAGGSQQDAGCTTGSGVIIPVNAAAAADIPAVAIQAYQQAAALHPGLDWTWIAAIGKVETDHGRYGGDGVPHTFDARGQDTPKIIGPMLDGSGVGGNYTAVHDTDHGKYDGNTVWDAGVGPMAFLPSSWVAFGQDGNGDGQKDPQNIFDAAAATAAVLVSAGAPTDMKSAVLTYNHAEWYYNKVKGYHDTYSAGATATTSSAVPARFTTVPRTAPTPSAVAAAAADPSSRAIEPAAYLQAAESTPAPTSTSTSTTATDGGGVCGGAGGIGDGSPATCGDGNSRGKPDGTVVYAGTCWYGGAGIDIYANGGSVHGTHWQCTELVRRFWKAKGWAPATWSGGMGKTLWQWRTPPGAISEPQGSITQLSAGDILSMEWGTTATGHVGIVNYIKPVSAGKWLVQMASQNTPAAMWYFDWDGHTLIAHNQGFPVTGVMHHVGTGATPSPTTKPTNVPATA